MDIDLSVILKYFQGLSRPFPARDWMIVAGVSLVAAIGCIGFAAYLFWSVQTGSIVSAGQEVPRAPIPVSRDAIKKALEIYEARATNYVARSFVVVDVIDPHPPKQ